MYRSAALSSLLHGVAVLLPTLLGMVLLSAADYGVYALVYLIYGLLVSFAQSGLFDPWVISAGRGAGDGWQDFTRMAVPGLFVLCLLAVGAVSLAPASLLAKSLLVAGLGMSLYKVGLRTFLVYHRAWSRVYLVDALAVLGTVLFLVIGSWAGLSRLETVGGAWAGGAVLACAAYRRPQFSPSALHRWLRSQKRVIRPLMVDTLVADASSIGTPFALLPLLGLSSFGIYRGVSNLSSPVRLVVSPLRPVLVGGPTSFLTGRNTAVLVGGAFLLGALAASGLVVVESLEVDLGVLSDVSVFAVAVGFYVWGSALLSVYPVICRGLGNNGVLYLGRACQTALGIVGPISGFLVADLQGAIWGFAVASMLAGLIWLRLARGARGGM